MTEGKIEIFFVRRELFLKSLIFKLLCSYNGFLYASIKLNHFQVMASSLNGLKVGDTTSGGGLKVAPQTSDLIDSSALTDTACFSKSLSSYPSNG